MHPSRFQVLTVDTDTSIKAFVISSGAQFKTGAGFYELTKSESISEKKEVVLQHVTSGMFYSGNEARARLGLAPTGTKKIAPRNVPAGYKAFVQSTSVNRKLIAGTSFLYEL